MTQQYHIHHIIPKHAGGTDDPTNLIKLTIEEHAEAHKLLYEQYNRWQDKLAYLLLSNQTTEGFQLMNQHSVEIRAELMNDPEWKDWFRGRLREGWIKRKERGLAVPWNKGLTKENNEMLRKISLRAKEDFNQGKLHCIGDKIRGTVLSDERKAALSEAAKKRKKVKCSCGKIVGLAMLTRWHKNCSPTLLP